MSDSARFSRPEELNEAVLDALYNYVRTISSGRVTSYGEVGGQVGVSARAAGWAMRHVVPGDKSTEAVPWQRVVGADGMLRIAQRSPELYRQQRALLEAEGVIFDDKGRVERRFFVGADAGDVANRERDENPKDGPATQTSLNL